MTRDQGSGAALEWAGVGLLTVCSILTASLELFLVPLYAGSTLVPVAVVLAVAGNVVFPRLASSLVNTALAAVLPFLGWVLVVCTGLLVTRPEGDVILPAGSGVEWVSWGVIIGGTAAAVVTLTSLGHARR